MSSADIQSSTVRLPVERNHDAAYAFDEKRPLCAVDRRAAEFDQLVEVDAASFARRGKIGRQWRPETPWCDLVHFVGGHRPSERIQQHRRIAGIYY